MNRRQLLRAAGLAALAAPFTAAHALAQPPAPPRLPEVQPGDVMTAQLWNDLVTRVNHLSNYYGGNW